MSEIVWFLLGVFVVAVVLMWRVRRGGSGSYSASPLAAGDRPDPGDDLEVARAHVGSSVGPIGGIGGVGGGFDGGMGGGGGGGG